MTNKNKLKRIRDEIEDSSPEVQESLKSVSESIIKSQGEHTEGLSKAILVALRTYQDKKVEEIRGVLKKESTEGLKKIRDIVDDLKQDLENSGSSFEEDIEHVYEEIESLSDLIENAMDTAVSTAEEKSIPKFKELDSKISEGIESLENKIEKIGLGIFEEGEKYQKSTKDLDKKVELLRADNKVHYKGRKEVGKQVLKLEAELKKLSKSIYEFGSSLSVLSNGSLVGASFGINFKNGTNTTVSITANAQGFIDVAINATGGGGSFTGSQEKSTTTPDGATQAFNFTHSPKLIFWNGAMQTLTDDYTVTGANQITFTLSAGTPLPGDKVTNVYA